MITKRVQQWLCDNKSDKYRIRHSRPTTTAPQQNTKLCHTQQQLKAGRSLPLTIADIANNWWTHRTCCLYTTPTTDLHPRTGTAVKKILHYPITVAAGHTLQTYGDHTATGAIRFWPSATTVAQLPLATRHMPPLAVNVISSLHLDSH